MQVVLGIMGILLSDFSNNLFIQWGITYSYSTIYFPLSFNVVPQIILVSTYQDGRHWSWNAGYRTVTKTDFYCENEVSGCYTVIGT